jgi:osmotically-inducible protein OsmY
MARRDTNVADLVSQALLIDDSLGAAIIEVKGAGGVITLKGTIESERDRQAAENLVRGQDGVVRVVNKLRVPEY